MHELSQFTHEMTSSRWWKLDTSAYANYTWSEIDGAVNQLGWGVFRDLLTALRPVHSSSKRAFSRGNMGLWRSGEV